jgi:uncharacterized phage-associated protein
MTPTRYFDYEADTALNAVLYIVSNIPDPTFHRISKLLYFADKFHLERYGRFICGDSYVAMKHGPVPAITYDLLKAVKEGSRGALDKTLVNAFAQALEVKGSYIVAKQEANLDMLSDSDLECLKEAIKEYGTKTLEELTALSHDAAYKSTDENDLIDLAAIISTLKDADHLLEHVQNPHP